MSKKLITVLLYIVVVFALVSCGFGVSEQNKENSSVPRLHVASGKIENEDGKTIQLTGMSSHGLLWYPEYINANAMETLKSYGANTFRIAAYSDDVGGGYVQNKEQTMQFVYIAIENAISADLYVIVDWHVLRDENPLTNLGSAIEFFGEISSHYGDCPNIIYEICNEPNGKVTWNEIYEYAEQVIPVIRNNAPNSIVIVGTPEYSYYVESVFSRLLDYDNIMYSFHYYAGQFDDHYIDLFNYCEKYNIPIFVSEWGINYDRNGNIALSDAERFVTVLNRRKISWVAWSLSNKDEVFSAIRSDCEKLSNWTLDDLTDAGRIFFEAFQ